MSGLVLPKSKSAVLRLIGVVTVAVALAVSAATNESFNPRKQVSNSWDGWVMASADLTGDGLADLVSKKESTGAMYFYRGLGGAGFAPRVPIASGW